MKICINRKKRVREEKGNKGRCWFCSERQRVRDRETETETERQRYRERQNKEKAKR